MDRVGDLSAAQRHAIGRSAFDGCAEEIVIRSEGTSQGGTAGESHQPDTVAAEPRRESGETAPGHFEATGRQILSIHAAGDIQKYEDVAAFGRGRRGTVPRRPAQRQHRQYAGGRNQRRLQPAPARVELRQQVCLHFPVRQRSQRAPTRNPGTRGQHEHGRD